MEEEKLSCTNCIKSLIIAFNPTMKQLVQKMGKGGNMFFFFKEIPNVSKCLDLFCRQVIGWGVQPRETGEEREGFRLLYYRLFISVLFPFLFTFPLPLSTCTLLSMFCPPLLFLPFPPHPYSSTLLIPYTSPLTIYPLFHPSLIIPPLPLPVSSFLLSRPYKCPLSSSDLLLLSYSPALVFSLLILLSSSLLACSPFFFPSSLLLCPSPLVFV